MHLSVLCVSVYVVSVCLSVCVVCVYVDMGVCQCHVCLLVCLMFCVCLLVCICCVVCVCSSICRCVSVCHYMSCNMAQSSRLSNLFTIIMLCQLAILEPVTCRPSVMHTVFAIVLMQVLWR